MRIVMLGINHRTAGVELRERLALAGTALDAAVDGFSRQYPGVELIILSTCNRTEFYLARPSHHPPDIQQLIAFVSEHCGTDRALMTSAVIHRENHEAAAHLFRVATGLDSMVLGEPQVLGQIKRAYEQAAARQVVGPVLHRLFQQAIASAKQVRRETGIDKGRVSVGSVAVDFAKRIFESFQDKTVLAIGAGDMAKLALRHLQALSPEKLWLVNRTPQRACNLAGLLGIEPGRGGARAWEDLDELLVEADIVLTSTAAPHPVITAERLKPLSRRRRNRPLFVIDLAVPRDVEPAVGTLTNVYLYNIDDLQQVVAQTHEDRRSQVQAADALLLDAARSCMSEVQNQDVGRLIRALRHRLHEMGQAESQRTLRRLATAHPAGADPKIQALLNEHTDRLINKILHLPMSQLDRRDADAPLAFYAAALRRLFALEEDVNHQEHQEHWEHEDSKIRRKAKTANGI